MSYGARAVIRLGAFRHNLRRLRESTGGSRLLAVVKSNAYGHGFGAAAEGLNEADGFAVARYAEALRLLEAGVKKPIVLLQGVANRRELKEAMAQDLEIVVHCEAQLRLLEAATEGRLTVWLKFDTGMNRLGFEPRRAPSLLARAGRCRAVRELRVMTHLASADDRDDETTRRQLDVFHALLKGFDGGVSIANSAGLLGCPDSVTPLADPTRCWVRAGLSLYGVSPFPGTRGADFGLQPVMTLETGLMDVKPLRRGEAVGYGGKWRAPRDTVLGIVGAGYGDGYSRGLISGTPLLVNGRRVGLAGLVSMDMAAADLGPSASDSIGDRVILWGENLPVEEVAECSGMSPYQLVAGVTHREEAAIVPD